MNKYIVYGAGRQGTGLLKYLKSKNKGDLVEVFCDNNKSVEELSGKRVIKYQDAIKLNLPFIIAIANDDERNEICKTIEQDGGKAYPMDALCNELDMGRVEFNRDYCDSFHEEDMDAYFVSAENALGTFWGDDTEFLRLFKKLDLTNVIEIACGRGSQVQNYISDSGEVTLVDILDKNIEISRERYKDYSNIKYYCNNGFNLCDLQSDKYSAVFSYDSVVHFEMMDIYEYLKDIYRVLKDGGKVLIHHSNNYSDYKASFGGSSNGRSFMSDKIFAYLAYRAGFIVLEQVKIDWGKEKELDCISLLQKKNILTN